jgi:hypothetical protein
MDKTAAQVVVLLGNTQEVNWVGLELLGKGLLAGLILMAEPMVQGAGVEQVQLVALEHLQ